MANEYKIKHGLIVEGNAFISGAIRISSGSAAGYLLQSDANGNAVWASTSSISVVSASYAFNATSASYANISDTATSASYANASDTATSASHANAANSALSSTSASYANASDTATSASYASTSTSASYAVDTTYFSGKDIAAFATTGSNSFVGLQTVQGALTIVGVLTAETYVISSSIIYVTTSFSSGSTIFGNSLDDTHVFTGSVYMSNSLYVEGPITASNIVYSSQTGSMTVGSASYALVATSASYSETATSSSYSLTSTSASYAETSTSSSYAVSASYSATADSASYSLSGSYSITASYASNVDAYAGVRDSNQNVTGSTNPNTIYTHDKGTHTAAFTKYVAISGLNVRAGQIMTTWSGSSIVYNEATTIDIGDTSQVVITMVANPTTIQMQADVQTGVWAIDTQTDFLPY